MFNFIENFQIFKRKRITYLFVLDGYKTEKKYQDWTSIKTVQVLLITLLEDEFKKGITHCCIS